MAIISKGKIFPSLILICVLFILSIQVIHAQTDFPEGFASVNALGQEGTTGGTGGNVVNLTNTAEFLDYINRTDAYIIQVNGSITLSGMLNVKSDKTIVGVDSNSIITGGGLNMSQVSKIIIRNLLFENSSVDGFTIEDESYHVWVDHYDFSHAYDGLLDIKSGSDYITVSFL